MCCENKDVRSRCSTIGSCPFSYSDESEQAQNYGCLPEPYEILTMRINHGKTWACHSDSSKPCLGAIKALKEKGHDYKVIDTSLVTLNDDWSLFTNPELSHKERYALVNSKVDPSSPI